MENTQATEKQAHPDGHQIRARQQIVEAANTLPLLDAAWKVIFYNRWRHRLGRPPYPEPISFGELERSWEEKMLASAISRANILYDDAYRIGDFMQNVRFEKKACRKATAEFMALHPGFSERTIDEAISHGCALAR